MKRKASVSHDEAIVRRLRKDSDFAAEYLKAALKMRTNPAFCSLPCATSPKPRASPKLLRPPASSERVFTGHCQSMATLACPRWLPSPRQLGSDSPSKPLHNSRCNLLSGCGLTSATACARVQRGLPRCRRGDQS